MEATLAEVLDGAEEMDRVRAALVLVGGEERVQKYRHFTLRDVVGGGYAVLTVVGVQRGPHVAVTRTATVDVAPTWLTDRYEDTRRVAATAAAATREAGRTDGTAGDVFVALHG